MIITSFTISPLPMLGLWILLALFCWIIAGTVVRVIENDKKVLKTFHRNRNFKWPEEEIRQLAGSESWGEWKPKTGMRGEQVTKWTGGAVLLKILDEDQTRYCVMQETGLVKLPVVKSDSMAKPGRRPRKITAIFVDTQRMAPSPTPIADMNHPYGIFCGEAKVNVLVKTLKARLAIRFEKDRLSFKVNGDMHVAYCKKNGYSVQGSDISLVSAQPCLTQEIEGAYLGVALKIKWDKQQRNDIQLLISGQGLIGRIGGKLAINLSQTQCGDTYKDEGGDLAPLFGVPTEKMVKLLGGLNADADDNEL